MDKSFDPTPSAEQLPAGDLNTVWPRPDERELSFFCACFLSRLMRIADYQASHNICHCRWTDRIPYTIGK